MTSRTPPAVGIDLGTTYSVVARLDDSGRPVSLVNADGDLLTPSVVLFEGEDVIVGKEALKALGSDADLVADCAKRDMGSRAYHRTVAGRDLPPEVVQAWVLRRIGLDAARQIGEFDRVVITVPAYFDEVRRKATQDAGYMAGFEVMDIINEPTAAALAFGFQQGYLNPRGEAHSTQHILVYDLGGGTFDVTVMQIRGREFIALSTDGDVQLGGRDWDLRLMDHVAEEFIRQHDLDPREDPNAAGRLWREIEEAKRTLSARSRATVAYEWRGRTLRTDVTRKKFEELTRDLLDRTRFTTRQALQAAALDWGSIDRVLLVGGSTRMPMVSNMLRLLTGKEPDSSVAADEAVAHGAALHAGLVIAEANGQPPPFRIQNVNSHSLGVVATDPKTRLERNAVVIPRNTPLPVTAKRIFHTQRDAQSSVLVQIVEGESPSADACLPVARCVIKDLPLDVKAHTAIDVRFHYKADGRLSVFVRVADTGRELEAELTRPNSLSRRDLFRWRQWILGQRLDG